MSYLSDYEKRMLKNREENKKVLASLGLDKVGFAKYFAKKNNFSLWLLTAPNLKHALHPSFVKYRVYYDVQS